VTLAKSAENRRKSLVRLTPRGKRLAETMSPLIRDVNDRAMADLSDAQALRRRGRGRRHHARHSARRIPRRDRSQRRQQTTLIGLIAGEVAAQQGTVRFDGTDITRLAAYRRSRLGLARSFQITSLFSEFTALDNVALAAQAHRGYSFRFWRDARREEELRKPAQAALARVGLAQGTNQERPDRLASRIRQTCL
jgi:hypothetical protein